jgi:hypothetical protein
MPITKKKKKKIIKLSASQKQKEKLKKKIRDREVAAIRGKALGTDKLGPLFDMMLTDNIFARADKVKNYAMLETFIEGAAPALSARDVAWIAAKYVTQNWNILKILKDVDYHGSVFVLFSAMDKTKGGAVALHKDYKAGKTGPLKTFCEETAYKVPASVSTFQDHMTMFKSYFGLVRKKTGAYKEKQRLEALERYNKKNLK